MSNSSSSRLFRYTGQIIFFTLFLLVLMVFSNSPSYRHFPEDTSLIKISISHPGQIKGECRERSVEEMAKLSPNMRVGKLCPRERSVILLELEVDGQLALSERLPPSGIQRDGVANIYKRLTVPTGKHQLVARMKDHESLAEYNYVKKMDINLESAQVFVIDFNIEAGGFVFH